MRLRRRLVALYSLILFTCLLLLGLAHHEFIREPRWRKEAGIPEPPERELSEFIEVFFYSMIPLVLGAGGWLIYRTLAPINSLTRYVEQIHARNLREPLPRTGKDEDIDHLIDVFNEMKSRVDESFQQIRQFTLHASHELKTPLTVMRAELETALSSDSSLSPEQREHLHSLRDETQRLAKIVEDLTLLAKADAGVVTLDLKPINLAELVRESCDDAQVLAEPQAIKVTLDGCADVTILGDRHRLRQLLLNLADNAVKYNQPGGAITMSLRAVNGSAEFTITNTGSSVPPEMQARVFDRFMRGDNARLAAVDGCGLGLSICQWIVKSHCGSIELRSTSDSTTVTVHLPLNPERND